MDIEKRLREIDFSGQSKIKDALLDRLHRQQGSGEALAEEELNLEELDMVTAAVGHCADLNIDETVRRRAERYGKERQRAERS